MNAINYLVGHKSSRTLGTEQQDWELLPQRMRSRAWEICRCNTQKKITIAILGEHTNVVYQQSFKSSCLWMWWGMRSGLPYTLSDPAEPSIVESVCHKMFLMRMGWHLLDNFCVLYVYIILVLCCLCILIMWISHILCVSQMKSSMQMILIRKLRILVLLASVIVSTSYICLHCLPFFKTMARCRFLSGCSILCWWIIGLTLNSQCTKS